MKRIFTVVLVCAVLLLSAGGAAFYYAKSQDFFFVQISELVKEGTGYALTKNGPLEGQLIPHPQLRVGDPQLSNLSSRTGQQIFKAKHLIVSLPWASVLQLDWVMDVQLAEATLNLQIDEFEQANWATSELQSSSDDLPFSLGQIDASRTQISFNNLLAGESLTLDLEHLSADLTNGESTVQIDSSGQSKQGRFASRGEIEFRQGNSQLAVNLSVGADLGPINQTPDLNQLQDNLGKTQKPEQFPAMGEIRGIVNLTDGLPHGQLDFSIETETLQALGNLTDVFQYLNPTIGPIATSGVLEVKGSDLDISKLDVRHQSQQLDVDVSGSIYNLLSETGTELHVKGQATQLKQLLSPRALNSFDSGGKLEPASLKLTGNLTTAASGISVDELLAGLSLNSLQVDLAGAIAQSGDSFSPSLEIKAHGADIRELSNLFEIEHPALEEPVPFDIETRISTDNHKFVLSNSSFHLDGGEISGTISGTFALDESTPNFELMSQLDVGNFARYAVLFPEQYTSYLNGLGAQISANFVGTPQRFSITASQAKLAHGDDTLQLSGEIRQLPDNPDIDVDVRYSTSQAIDLERYNQKLKDIQLVAPLELTGNIKGDQKKIKLQRLHLSADQTDVAGEVNVDFQTTPPKVAVRLHSSNFTTRLIEPETLPTSIPAIQADETEVPQDTSAIDKATSKELGERFNAYTSNIAIDSSWVDQLDLSLQFTADRMQVSRYDTQDLLLKIEARDGIFAVEKYRHTLDGKPLSLTGSIDTQSNPPTYQLAGEIGGETLENLLPVEDNLIKGGALNGELKLSSSGITVAELIENLSGNAVISMGELAIRSTILDSVSSSVFSTMLKGVVSSNEEYPTSRYECGVLGVDIQEGVARINRSFAMQAIEYNLAGNGSIDLNTGTVDIRIVPKAKKGLGLSISTIVGGLHLKGNMATPDFGVSGGLVSALILGYAVTPVATAGLAVNPVTATLIATGYVLSGLVDRITASNYSCEKTQDRIQRRRLYTPVPGAGTSAPTPFF